MPHDADSNPLRHATSAAWDRLVGEVNPPSMLVAIRAMMSGPLRQRFDADDVWQETLLHAWRDRENLEWRGPGAFRRWLLEIARHRVCDLSDAAATLKRGAGRELRFADRSVASDSNGAEHYAGPMALTTPGRAAADRERADLLEQALGALPNEWRDVVRLRLFEDRTLEEIAARLGIGVEGVRYRFRRGAEAYRRELRRRRAVGSETQGQACRDEAFAGEVTPPTPE